MCIFTHKQTYNKNYNTYDEICEKFDGICIGSDQIWNTYFNNGYDSSFYLQFGNKNIVKASYAASFAQEEKDYGVTIHVLDIKTIDLLSCASEISPLANSTEKRFTLYSNNRHTEVQDSEMCKFYESGIEFVDVTSIRGKNDWDFYDGAEITWKEIQEGKAIKRQGYSIYLENLKQKINSNRSIYYPILQIMFKQPFICRWMIKHIVKH